MTRIICIDASTEACSAALLNGDEVTERFQIAPRQHARLLLPMVDELLQQSDLKLNQLDAIACHTGPGAFTGIRIAVSVAQGLAYGANLPTISVSSLANLAQQAVLVNAEAEYWCAIDARMQEVYFAVYKANQQKLVEIKGDECVIAPEQIDFNELIDSSAAQQRILTGSGWEAYQDTLNFEDNDFSQQLINQLPRAKFGLPIAEDCFTNQKIQAPELLQPCYLRNNVAVKKVVNR